MIEEYKHWNIVYYNYRYYGASQQGVRDIDLTERGTLLWLMLRRKLIAGETPADVKRRIDRRVFYATRVVGLVSRLLRRLTR